MAVYLITAGDYSFYSIKEQKIQCYANFITTIK